MEQTEQIVLLGQKILLNKTQSMLIINQATQVITIRDYFPHLFLILEFQIQIS